MKDAAAITPLPFLKMHGLGNDFVILDSRGRDAMATPELARALGDRHRGVGFDQLAELRGTPGSYELDFWNADGSRAEACGNATRCVSAWLMETTGSAALELATMSGNLVARRTDRGVSVNMGHPREMWDEIPLAQVVDPLHLPLAGDPVAISMGNPHCVFFVPKIDAVDVAARGSLIETDPLFPNRTNVEFAEIRSRTDIRMRVWERGAGITLACGSGACATLGAAVRRGLTETSIRMELDGGWLWLDWREDGIWMTGPTAHVFSGALTPTFLSAL